MSLPQYERYNSSGTDWLGDVPSHWRVVSGSILGRLFGSEPIPEDLVCDSGSIPFLKVGSLSSNSFEVGSWDWFLDGTLADQCRPKANFVVFPKRGAAIFLNKVNIVERPSLIDPNLMGWEISEQSTPRFVAYLLKVKTLRKLADISTVPQINNKHIYPERFPVPPLGEQFSIIQFLDRETHKIDDLIAEQKHLIELLKEKRHAVISRAVCKGLNPAAPMKDSSIKWLGSIPEHWALPALSTRFSIELGKMLDESRITGHSPIPYLRNVDVQWNWVNFTDLPVMDITEAEFARYTVRAGDLLVCEGGEAGRAAVVTSTPGVVGFQKALHRLRPRQDDETADYMYYTLAWAASTNALTLGGSSTIQHLTAEQLRRFRFPKPPKSEQLAIAEYLRFETSKIDALINEVNATVDLLQERRTALISAAVTGKIDVRSLAVESTAKGTAA